MYVCIGIDKVIYAGTLPWASLYIGHGRVQGAKDHGGCLQLFGENHGLFLVRFR